jgi:hypothetical protein
MILNEFACILMLLVLMVQVIMTVNCSYCNRIHVRWYYCEAYCRVLTKQCKKEFHKQFMQIPHRACIRDMSKIVQKYIKAEPNDYHTVDVEKIITW